MRQRGLGNHGHNMCASDQAKEYLGDGVKPTCLMTEFNTRACFMVRIMLRSCTFPRSLDAVLQAILVLASMINKFTSIDQHMHNIKDVFSYH